MICKFIAQKKLGIKLSEFLPFTIDKGSLLSFFKVVASLYGRSIKYSRKMVD
jgi:hypothetical protein